MDDWRDTPDWEYLGDATISRSVNRIQIPEKVFEYGIVRDPDTKTNDDTIGNAHWSYDTATGWVILSDRELDDDITIQEGKLVEGGLETVRYKSPGVNQFMQVGGKGDGHRVTIPKAFFEDAEGIERVPESVCFQYGETRHFVTASEFVSDKPTPTKSCYLLTTEQLNTILRDEYDPSAGDTPRFI